MTNLVDIIDQVKPTALLGLSTMKVSKVFRYPLMVANNLR